MTLTRPVHNALLPELAESPDELTASNSASSTVEGLGILVGPLLNSVIVAGAGPEAVVAACAMLMGGAAIATGRLRLRGTDRRPATGRSERGILRSTVATVGELRADAGAAVLTVLGSVQFVIFGMLDVLYAVLAIDVLGAGEKDVRLVALERDDFLGVVASTGRRPVPPTPRSSDGSPLERLGE